ncbi:hypothetical protein RF11_15624 [Thelohanellus kitauei]|uniref:Uncharacterized protein n=1 Tax=Thelohanellus kitauei TaxID=669202 RepID=A0A0C2NIR2_THEKT|nr:hypothetical protein RF11_15624 [Thelohanellus kitauei]
MKRKIETKMRSLTVATSNTPRAIIAESLSSATPEVSAFIPRTINNIEGWHRAFSSMVSANYPNVCAFLNATKLENSLTDHKIDTAISTADFQGQRGERYDNNTNQITSILENSENLSHLELLGTIS